ncbi:MAG: extracellular solute-binding protein, partial [Chloroflexota bacterium]|nr:extracellular solute-binding protein [Chloroflexota bacterium]
FDPKHYDFFWMWGAGNGGTFISDDAQEVSFNDPKLVEALDWGVKAYDAQGGFPSFDAFRTTFQGNEEFARGQVAMICYENWMLGIVARVAPALNFALLPVKERNGDGLVSFTGGFSWAIPTDAKDPEAAWEFIKFMNADETWLIGANAVKEARVAAGQVYIPALTANRTADQLQIDQVYEPISPQFDAAVNLFPQLIEASPNRPVSKSPVGGQLQDVLTQDGVLPALRGELSAEDALNQANDAAQDAIDSF